MYEPQPCFKCGQLGHLKAQCPSRRTPAAKAPAAPSDEGGPVEKKVQFKTGDDGTRHLVMDIPEWTAGPVADSAAWAARIRKADPRMGDDGEAREQRLRILAAEQAAEARNERKGMEAA